MLGSKLEQGYYWYNDEYMYFSFNGHHSSKYHLFIQNSKELTIENAVGESSEYSNAMMQEGTYYLGTSRKQKTFKRKCAAELNNMQDYRRMMKWLTVGATGELVFDSDRYWGWSVVLDSVGDATFAVRGDLLIVEFEITFKTIGTYLAHSVYPATWIQPQPEYDQTGAITGYKQNMDIAYADVIGTNRYNIPTVFATTKIDKDSNNNNIFKIDCYILDLGNIKQDFTLYTAPDTSLTGATQLTIDSIIHYQDYDNYGNIANKQNLTTYLIATFQDVDGKANFNSFEFNNLKSTLYVNELLAEDNTYCKQTIQPNGLMRFESNEPIELYTQDIKKDGGSTAITITLDDESWDEFISGEFDYLCVSKKQMDHTGYSIDAYVVNSDQDYKAEKISYTGISEIIDCNHESCNKIGPYAINVQNRTITISNLVVDENIDNTYQVYCGNIKHFSAIITNDDITSDIPFMIQVVSYNNL